MSATNIADTAGDIIRAGARLDVGNPDGSSEGWVLARHSRFDAAEDVLWVRPLIGGHRDRNGQPVFPVEDCKRRGIAWDTADIDADTVVFGLGSGQRLELKPATTNEDLERLELWDTFMATVLDANDELALDALDS